MLKKIISFFIFFLVVYTGEGQTKKIVKGRKITRSVKIKPAVYILEPGADIRKPIVIIEGSNITVDFRNAELMSTLSSEPPDRFRGLAVLVRDGRNVTIRNLKIRGFKVALMGENVDGLTVENCDFSYNYRPHLNSTQEKEDISDWMSYHHNEKDEWLRYGAAIYLKGCRNAVIKKNKVTGGQNALMMTDCDYASVYNNDFSFNSGIGIGMYRCSNNNIAFNTLIFNVRGYSHGVYNRGQDSAGILVYEQSSNNFFYRNNVTHGGDGFFLWAGQSTMDSGSGGCNDNIIMGNDFSYAPTNGIEVTFSRNIITGNRLFECDHGIWGGYSYETNISTNRFRDNRIDIAIEHGQKNYITYNIFYKSREAIRLWARASQPADWGYARNRDTRSRKYLIAFNNFNDCETVFNFNRSSKLAVFGNIYTKYDRLFVTDSTVKELDSTYNEDLAGMVNMDTVVRSPAIKDAVEIPSTPPSLRGREHILMTEWGPYDYGYPLIWNSNPTDTSAVMKFKVLGPAGRWKVTGFRGVKNISAEKGEFPATITAEKTEGERTDIRIDLVYNGPAFTDRFGNAAEANRDYVFSFRKFFQPVDFTVNWYAFDSSSNPVKTGVLFPENVLVRPFRTENVKKLDYAWWGGIKADRQYEQFITVAEGKAELDKGRYELGVTWDDAVRLYIDGKQVMDEWNPSLYQFDESPHRVITVDLERGEHYFRVEHVELGGFATLSLKLNRIE